MCGCLQQQYINNAISRYIPYSVTIYNAIVAASRSSNAQRTHSHIHTNGGLVAPSICFREKRAGTESGRGRKHQLRMRLARWSIEPEREAGCSDESTVKESVVREQKKLKINELEEFCWFCLEFLMFRIKSFDFMVAGVSVLSSIYFILLLLLKTFVLKIRRLKNAV